MFIRFLCLVFAVFSTFVFAQTPEWIWFNKTDSAETRYLRKVIEIAGQVTRADVTVTADDAFELFLNGKSVASGEEWTAARRVNVTSNVTPGKNVIGLRVKNGDNSPAGVILRLDVTTPDGRKTFVTDGTWKGSDKEAANWMAANFNDGAWGAAKSLGKLGVTPWGDVFIPQAGRPATAAEQLWVMKDFKVELLTSAETEEGSWVNLCKDDKGRILISPQYRNNNPDAGILRITLENGKVAKREFIAQPLYDVQGMTFANGALWVVVNKYSTKFESGLYRITDDGSDKWNKIELVKAMPGNGEHGPHAVELGPDGNLWVIAGNHTKPPQGLAAESPHKNYAEDHVLPRDPDGNGHATGIMAPGGYVMRVSPDAKKFELFCAGFRNEYDFAFNADGEIFAWDADMEYDWGVPWYRPTRVNHAVSGAEFGWRYGTGKWPAYSPDSLGAVVDIGIGCPTGVTSGKGSKFPAKYQNALFVLDWTFGRLMAVHLTPSGASYTGTFENFVAPAGLVEQGKPKPPLNLTDAIIGADGNMYFTVGGRGTASGLYRVTYTGGESIAPAWKPNVEGSKERALRKKLEALHMRRSPDDGDKVDSKTIDFIWDNLKSSDRHIRYAARVALEVMPLNQWRNRALKEKDATAGPTALLALARVGGPFSDQENCLRRLSDFSLEKMTEEQQLTVIRALQVSISRNGTPEDVSQLIQKLDRQFPSKLQYVNRELAQVMIALGAPKAVEKGLALMSAAKTQEEMIHYLFHLRTAKNWTSQQRAEYLSYWRKDRQSYGHEGKLVQWFDEAGRPYSDGASFNPFLRNFLSEAVANMTDAEKKEFASEIDAINKGMPSPARRNNNNNAFPAAKQRTLVKDWTMADLEREAKGELRGRNFNNGRQAYVDAQCLQCHKFGNEGGSAGPDLTAVSTRFTRRDILESILEPSKVVSEQFQNTAVMTNDGDEIVGRLVEDSVDKMVLIPNPLQPDVKVEIKKASVKSHGFSKLSPMPNGLASVLSKEDVLDLLAFLESGGRRNAPVFQR